MLNKPNISKQREKYYLIKTHGHFENDFLTIKREHKVS